MYDRPGQGLMAQQKFSADFRNALWEAHGRRCIYCRKPLLFSDMRIDHVIPEHLVHGDPDRRIAILQGIGLPANFDIQGNANLAPSCEQCNSEKSGDLLIEGTNPVTLTRVAKALSKLQKLLQQQKSAKDLDQAILIIVRALEHQKFTAEDFIDRLKEVFPGMIPEERQFEVNRELQVDVRTWSWIEAVSDSVFKGGFSAQVRVEFGFFSFTFSVSASFNFYVHSDLRFLEDKTPKLLQYRRDEKTGVFSLFIGLGDDDLDA
jgi:5-methylcytosine-specific restriction endonuclease McrA